MGALMACESTGQSVDDSYEPWRDLTTDIRALRPTGYDIADRLRSAVARRPSWPRRRRDHPSAALLASALTCRREAE
ncbi:hypothetical protein [Streptomyces sp. NPDC096105]|uniref:hypothetical protein n=1 Tax=Streptomyces sp. NPDC096105 TaxID=3366074 RepID=UPI003806FFE2